jgi:ParB-like chromosome segregation protein Spo0J
MSQGLRSNGVGEGPGTLVYELQSGPDGDILEVSREVVKVRTMDLRVSDSPRLNGLDPDHVRTLTEIGEPLPPIIVHYPTLRIIDGMHRLEAARINGRTEIEVRFFRGDWTDVFRLAVRANVAHGLPLTRTERKAAAARILLSHPQLSDRSIAYTAGLAAKTVARIRRSRSDGNISTRVGRDGRARPLSTADGRRIALRVISDRPNASLREIAAEAGISVGTVRDVRARLESGQNPMPTRRQPACSHGSPGMENRRQAVRQDADPVDVGMVLAGLRRDPSLRYTEAGRTLLRCLGTHVTTMAQLREAVERVPPHCVMLVAKIARDCADTWSSLATELDQRSRESA